MRPNNSFKPTPLRGCSGRSKLTLPRRLATARCGLTQALGITKTGSAMSDFATKTSKPTAVEYLAASEAELLDRLNINPTGHQSEFPFIQSVIALDEEGRA